MLTDQAIQDKIDAGHIEITPYDPARLNPNSYNLCLADKLLVYEIGYHLHNNYGSNLRDVFDPLDMKHQNPTRELYIPSSGLVLYPHILYLGSTVEHTKTPHHIPLIEGRSSVARLGLSVHLTAGFGDVGFEGDWTLEITVIHPLRVYANTPILQIAYDCPNGEIRDPYKGKYQGQRGPKASELWRDFLPKP